jgi:hypothetical protein
MSNLSLVNHSLALAAHQRGLGTPESRFVAEQLERVAQLLRFTAAETPDQYFDRLFANEESEKEAAFERGYQEGRMSVIATSHPCHN